MDLDKTRAPRGNWRVEEGGNQEEMLPELMMFEPKGEYRVCALTADNKDILLAIAPLNRNAPI